MSLSFLSKKSWHTAKKCNVESTWMAEEKVKADRKAAEERERTVERELEREAVERAIGGQEAVDRHQLRFMYERPGGGKEEDANT